MSISKPFYSRRRLKKMGIKVETSQAAIFIQITSSRGNIRQSYNIVKMLKNEKRSLRINVVSTGSCGSWILMENKYFKKQL